MIEPYCDWPTVHAALRSCPAPFYVTLNDLLRAGRQAGSGLKHVRHNGSRSGRPLWRRDLILRYLHSRWKNAPEIYERFREALLKYKPEMRSH